jgi:hypothetical protein
MAGRQPNVINSRSTHYCCVLQSSVHTHFTHFALEFSLDVDRLDKLSLDDATLHVGGHVARRSPRPIVSKQNTSSLKFVKIKIEPKPVHYDSGKGPKMKQAEHVNVTSALDNVCTGNEQAGRLGYTPRAAGRWRWWSHPPLSGVAFDLAQRKCV